ncbi:hypothetical protein TNCV_3818411 [Trichonephila clavipes]|nr:hypothetical protein TNCV_3818411 [Trichonephila clavipes]
MLSCLGTNAAVERAFSVGSDFWTSEKSRLNVNILVLTIKFNSFQFDYLERRTKGVLDKSFRSIDGVGDLAMTSVFQTQDQPSFPTLKKRSGCYLLT